MKLSFKKSSAFNAFKKAASSTGKLQQINQYLLISSDDKGIFVAGNDGSMTIKAYFDADATEFDGICVESDKMIKSLNAMGENISLEYKDGALHIKSGKSKIKLRTLDADQFYLDHTDMDNSANVDALDFVKAMTTVIHAAGINDVRRFMNGVYLTDNYMVATDGHRLVSYEIPVSGNVIIPQDNAGKIAKSIDIESESVQILSTGSKLHIHSSGIEIHTLLIDGRFPDWKGAMFQTSINFSVNRDDLINAINISTVTANSQTYAGILKSDGSSIHVSAAHNNNESESSFDCQCDEFLIGINVNYLMQCLKQCDAVVEIGINPDMGITIKSGNMIELITRMMV